MQPIDYSGLFKFYQSRLKEVFQTTSAVAAFNRDHALLVKADMSGIQDFIFNIKSDGAAKQLKGRSFIIQAIAFILEHEASKLKGFEMVYNAGGNMYFFVDTSEEKTLEEFQKNIWESLKDQDLTITLAWISTIGETDFGELIQNKLEKAVLIRKLGIEYKPTSFFDCASATEGFGNLEQLTKSFSQAIGYVITDLDEITKLKSYNAGSSVGVSFLKSRLLVKPAPETGLVYFSQPKLQYLVNHLPTWRGKLEELRQESMKWPPVKGAIKWSGSIKKVQLGEIISFENLASLAKHRTGTEKLGVLKFDVDNLGKIFEGMKSVQKSKELSGVMSFFFEGYINHLLSLNVTGDIKKTQYRDNIYVVFSGGDDGFMVGAWDAVFQFAVKLQKEFARFCGDLDTPLTLSASLLLIDEKFPVIRFAELAESDLSKAKSHRIPELDQRGLPAKNSICLFGQAVTWQDLTQIILLKNDLVALVNKQSKYGQPKALLNVIKQSVVDFNRLKSGSNEYNFPKVWRLRYYFREQNMKEQDKGKGIELINKIVSMYEKNLLDSYLNDNNKLAYLLPLAARWAEFETR